MIRALFILLGHGTTLYAAQMAGGNMPGATGMDSDMDGVDDAFDATPYGVGGINNNPAKPQMPKNIPPASGDDDGFNQDDPSGATDDDDLSAPTPTPPPMQPHFGASPQPNFGAPAHPMQSAPMRIGRNTFDPDETRGAPVDTSAGASIPGFKQLTDDKQQHKLKGMDNVRFLQTALLEGDKDRLCGENGICRRNFGEGCIASKNFLSVCATMCVDNNDFRGSHCIINGAKRYKMNAQTFIYEPRPDKQKKAESVVDHIIVQLREGRKALRSDKRLFFNTFCTPPSVNMIPGDANRRRIAEACAYFLYNGYPPPGVLELILIGRPAQPQSYIPSPMPMAPQPAEPQPPADSAAPADGSPDDINAPVGGLPADPDAGEDKGATYDGPGTPIIEDKEAAPTKKKVKKGKKGKKGKKSRAAKKAVVQAAPADDATATDDQATPPTDDSAAAAPADDGSTPPDDSTTAPAADDATPPTDDGTTPPADDSTAAAPADDGSTPPDDSAAAPDDAAPAPQQQAAPPKQKGLMGALGGAGGIQGMMQKFGKKKGAPAQQGADGDTNADADAGGNQGGKMPSAVGKFMKF